MTDSNRNNVPAVEDGGLDDKTIASPALGYGLERVDITPDQDLPSQGRRSLLSVPDPAMPERKPETLGYNEVAAVSTAMPMYVSDAATPYLSSRQAQEDIRDTKRRHLTITTAVVLTLVFAALIAAGVFAYNLLSKKDSLDVAQYNTVTVIKGEFLDTIDTTSLVRPAVEQIVGANVAGTIQEALVSEGSEVNEGDVLFTLSNPSITDSRAKAQEDYDRAYSTSQDAHTKLDEAKAEVEDCEKKLKKAKSSAEKTVAQAALTTAEGLVTAAESETQAADATLQTMQDMLTHAQEQEAGLVVYAPISGTVTALSGQTAPSSSVAKGSQLCTISDLSHFVLELDIPQELRPQVSEGKEVRLSFPTKEDLEVTSTVSNIEDREEASVAIVNLDDPDEDIQPGMAADASIVIKSIPNSLMVPKQAIQHDEDGSAYLNVLLDATRGIETNVAIQVLATNDEYAAVEGESIQKNAAVILPAPETEDPEE